MPNHRARDTQILREVKLKRHVKEMQQLRNRSIAEIERMQKESKWAPVNEPCMGSQCWLHPFCRKHNKCNAIF